MSSPMANGSQMFTAATNTSISGGTFQSANNIVYLNNPQAKFQRGLKILEKHIAPGAFHNSAERFDPPKCYPNTREAILARIEAWVKKRPQNGRRLVLWMYGPAGAGKSAIAQSIAELCEALLAASFFFSRTAEGRNDSSRLVATIVWQLIKAIPEIREVVLHSLELDPSILSRTPAVQMQSLIVEPLNQVPRELLAKRPHLVIIDGLDECLPPKSQDDILEILSTSLQRLNTPLYFLVASRPHSNIRRSLTSDPFRSIIHTLPLQSSCQSIEDIRHFLTSSFAEIRTKHEYLPPLWPTSSDIEALVDKSSGLFIYAGTVIRYVSRGNHGHEKRLKAVLERSCNNSATPFAALDSLYLQILQSVEEDAIEDIMLILGAVICIQTYKFGLESQIEEFFNYRPGELRSIMGDMLALVNIPDPWNSVDVEFYHASFTDFLLDPTRSRSFFLDPATVHLNLVQYCLKHHGPDRFSPDIPLQDQDTLHQTIDMLQICIFSQPFTMKLGKLLLEFSLWNCLPAQIVMLFHSPTISLTMDVLKLLREHTEFYEAQLRHLDNWIYKLFLSVPQHLRHMILVSFDIEHKLHTSPPFYRDMFRPLRLYLLFVELKFDMIVPGLPRLGETGEDFFDIISPRFPILFSQKLPLTESHYTKFAIWIAKHSPEWTNRYMLRYMLILGPYLAESLTHCQVCQVLVDLLTHEPYTTICPLASTMEVEEPYELYTVDRISQYIKRCERFFDAQAKDNSEATESLSASETSATLSIEQPVEEIVVKSGLLAPETDSLLELSVGHCSKDDMGPGPVEPMPEIVIHDTLAGEISRSSSGLSDEEPLQEITVKPALPLQTVASPDISVKKYTLAPGVDVNDKPTQGEISAPSSGSAISVMFYAILVSLVLSSILPWHFLFAAILFIRLYKGSIL